MIASYESLKRILFSKTLIDIKINKKFDLPRKKSDFDKSISGLIRTMQELSFDLQWNKKLKRSFHFRFNSSSDIKFNNTRTDTLVEIISLN
ncbi:hypothetical protein BpHYR1_051366 [Brachionus plicatilis]|uniref:Uncharacterized protein n=1 Tax=Brachionus plicatilis TaxID=10195 RepID=A0A3M7RKN3_BRAPC|nr:hypothetical protein BpHYR1_051366 [Brachionus plicatilis]